MSLNQSDVANQAVNQIESASSILSIFSELSSSGTLAVLLALTGWFFIYFNSRLLQKRSETWAVVKNISDLLQEIENESKIFWLDTGESNNALLYETKINSLLPELERWLNQLTYRVKKGKNKEIMYKNGLVNIFKDATFDTENKKQMHQHKKLKKVVLIQKHTKNIKESIDDDFRVTFL